MTIAKALEQVGRTLQEHYAESPIPSRELKQQAARLSGHQESSIIPSDFCYNRINAGIPQDNNRLFIQEGRGQYQFVGANYPYTGARLHKPQGKSERIVGYWAKGEFTLNERP